MEYDLRLGEILTLIIENQRCASNLQEITPRGTMILSAPTFRGAVIPLRANDKVQMIYYRASGQYSCIIEVAKRLMEKGMPLVEAELRSPISKYQRREFVRFDTLLPVTVIELVSAEKVKNMTLKKALQSVADRKYSVMPAFSEPILGMTMDISGGGARVSSPIEFEADTILECEFTLRDDLSATAEALVLRCDTVDSKDYPFQMTLKFVLIEEKSRKKIIKYIFDEQLKRR